MFRTIFFADFHLFSPIKTTSRSQTSDIDEKRQSFCFLLKQSEKVNNLKLEKFVSPRDVTSETLLLFLFLVELSLTTMYSNTPFNKLLLSNKKIIQQSDSIDFLQ